MNAQLLATGTCCFRPGRFGVAPNAVQPYCIGQIVGNFTLFVHRPRPQATTNSQRKKLKCASHEHVCLVSESLDKHLPVPGSLKEP